MDYSRIQMDRIQMSRIQMGVAEAVQSESRGLAAEDSLDRAASSSRAQRPVGGGDPLKTASEQASVNLFKIHLRQAQCPVEF